ncbi:MAG: malonyl-CoA synthase [Burkholderiales bacterium]|jgi:malonyl-CoA/methylmalonyl-CoA synthetase|uniref:AMP-binding protein n=1 Tax=Candidatus Desulfobacillus denitrificans TaxID=2608985 RepID=A0A809S7A1_9PROT|nr:malonyl-CoA synthase [Burkholderiales bacterium]BBO22151.1 AMP-binding protein [Candidatus Desulfobacillus denitrificans]GIK47072.1 MAG: malonyl-CoA synthase [Betaproteobacteria bacterium]GJQ54662.1 MAG: malonyl-CoA synthase [Rhodocyclaceae bacterium]
MNLYDLLASRFPAEGEAPCLILPDGRRLSYAELESQSARYGALLAEAGLKPGDRVAAQVEKSAEALLLYLGCLRAGCVFLPLNPAYTRGEVAYFLDDARPGLFVCTPERLEEAQELAWACRLPRVHDLGARGEGSLAAAAAQMPARFATVERADGDLASIVYTSGTTGRSKGAMLTHRNLAANALVLHKYWGFRPGDVLLHMLPTFHVHGLFVATHCALLNGSPMLFEPKFDAARALRLMQAATVFMGVPTYYTRLLQERGLTREAVAHMRLFISGSAPLLPETFAEFRERTGQSILERYGMTEGGMFTSNPLEGERRGGTVGFPLPGTEVRVVDDSDRPLPAGEIGHIQVRGENVFAGYWRMPEKTREEFTPEGYFRTGDLGRFDADGYLAIIGRDKDLIITGGLNVYPKEIEEAIDALPGVAESAVIGLPHSDFGEAVTAVVVRGKASATTSGEAIIAELKGRLAGFKVPKAVLFVDELPRNAMGKVQKNLLRQRFSA